MPLTVAGTPGFEEVRPCSKQRLTEVLAEQDRRIAAARDQADPLDPAKAAAGIAGGMPRLKA